MAADYRVRIQIKQSLENNYSKNRDQPFAVNIAFQVAFCYLIGFGVKSNDIQCRIWLESSMRKPDQLKIEKEAVQPARWKNKRMRELNGIVLVNLNHEYRVSGFNKLEEACQEYEREVSDMAREFGEIHFIPLTSMNNLASTYRNLGRSKEAEELLVQVMETLKRVLGQEHPSTLTSMNNLALTYTNQGRSKEAEELVMQVMETRKRVLGQEHPSTLTSMHNLASTYMRQGRWKEAEELQIDAVNRLRTTLGDDHPTTLQAIANLASFREERTNEPKEVLRDILLQFAASWYLDEGNADREMLQRTFKMLQKDATEDDDPMTDEERLQLVLAVSREVDNNDTDEDRLRRALPMSIEVDEDNETNEERLQRALAMSMEDKNDNDEIGGFKSTPIEADEDDESNEVRLQLAVAMSLAVDDNNDTNEGRLRRVLAMAIEVDEHNETNDERLQRALAMSMEGENGKNEIGSLKREYSPDTNSRLTLVADGFIYT
jgi:tetratricopeptide (TPR) repeat protein